MIIYFVQGEITRRIKIGFTANFITSRLQPMRSSSPDKLTYLGGMPGTRDKERKIQSLFEKYHSHGEWYEENDDLISYININCLPDGDSLEIIINDIENGMLDYEQALKMTRDQIKDIQRKRIRRAFERIYKNIELPEN